MPYVYPAVTEPLTQQQSIWELFAVVAVMGSGFLIKYSVHPIKDLFHKLMHKEHVVKHITVFR